MDQGAAEPKLLLHAARELAGLPAGEGGKAGPGQQEADALLSLRSALAEQTREGEDVLSNG